VEILQDTREQTPLKFHSPFITSVAKKKLDFGDYGAKFKDGTIPNIFFERKTIGDLYGTMGKGYPRFKKEIERSQMAKATLFIIVDGTLTEVGKGYKHSKIYGKSMKYKLFTLWVKHGIQTIFTANSKEMAEYITQFYIGCGKEHVRRLNA
jgi:ERCC4-type nuclease